MLRHFPLLLLLSLVACKVDFNPPSDGLTPDTGQGLLGVYRNAQGERIEFLSATKLKVHGCSGDYDVQSLGGGRYKLRVDFTLSAGTSAVSCVIGGALVTGRGWEWTWESWSGDSFQADLNQGLSATPGLRYASAYFAKEAITELDVTRDFLESYQHSYRGFTVESPAVDISATRLRVWSSFNLVLPTDYSIEGEIEKVTVRMEPQLEPEMPGLLKIYFGQATYRNPPRSTGKNHLLLVSYSNDRYVLPIDVGVSGRSVAQYSLQTMSPRDALKAPALGLFWLTF